MTRIRPLALTLLAALLALAAAPMRAGAQSPSTGILLLAHGGAKHWNQGVADAAAAVNGDQPVEIAFGMATRRNIQSAIDRLIARGVTDIVAVPLFVSPYSSVVRSTEYLLGLRPDAPADLALFAKMAHGPGGHAGHADHGAPAPGAEDGTKPVVSPVPVRMSPALGRHPLVAAMLADRATSISQDPAGEVVVLVAHGPVPADDNARWLDDLAALAAGMKATTRFKAIESQTLRDDAPAPIRDEAAAELRARVSRITAAGDRVLLVPVVISFGGIENGIRKRLEGLPYTMAAQGLLPDARIARWIRESANAPRVSARHVAGTRLFDSVTVSATLNPTAVLETPGTVAVIDDETIARRLVEHVADLVKFEPGVYVETVANRVGLNGFNIRGIGGNRVMTQVDGVETSEQFDFGPFNVHQFALDLDTLKSAEIVRSAGSALYGSDALGGVVSLFTKDPADYLGGRAFHAAGKTGYDGRSDETGVNGVVAGGRGRVAASLFASAARGSEGRNRGGIETETSTRTALNPQDRRSAQGLGKVAVTLGSGNVLRGAVEIADNDIETDAFSLRSPAVLDITSDDSMRRRRASVDQQIAAASGRTQWAWNAFVQSSATDQVVRELRAAGRPDRSQRHARVRTGHVRRRGAEPDDALDRRPRRPGDGRRRLQAAHLRHATRPRRRGHRQRRHRAAGGADHPDEVLPEKRRPRGGRLRAGRDAPGPPHARPRRPLRPFLARRRRARRRLPGHAQPDGGRFLRRRRVVAPRRRGPGVGRRHAPRPVRGRLPRAAVQRGQQRVHESPGRLHVGPEHGSRR
jgi:sirohydrochlorin ferrochelatase